jgi:hypothetical protein
MEPVHAGDAKRDFSKPERLDFDWRCFEVPQHQAVANKAAVANGSAFLDLTVD